MRSSKNRSRSKGNRNRSVGNVVNRVFDSSGPEGKVRGTPQQIIDKYNQLTRDAQLSNDRVAAENFQQHAEHYLRLLSEAQREMEARREQQQQQQQNNQQNNQQNRDGGQQAPQGEGQQARNAGEGSDGGAQGSFDTVMDGANPEEGGPVETPENAPKNRQRRNRSRRKPEDAAQADAPSNNGDDSPDQSQPEAAE